jgi:hypothetical protein
MAPGLSIAVSFKSTQLAGTAGFHDHVAIRQVSTHAYSAAFCMMTLPAIVMAAIDVFTNNNVIVALVDNHLRGHRKGARKHPNSRA